VRGPKLRLNAASAQSIGLALHELATNAGKYGALSVDTGRINEVGGLTAIRSRWTGLSVTGRACRDRNG
jgi:two-component sensor histidine kinase